MPRPRKFTIRQRIARFIRTKRKAIAAGVSQLVTTGISWLGLHVGLQVDPETAAWISGTVGAAVSAFVVHEFTNALD